MVKIPLDIPYNLCYSNWAYVKIIPFGMILFLLVRICGSEDHRREVKSMGVFQIILVVLEVIASIGLIAVVLMQSGKEAGLSGALAGNNDSYLAKGKAGNLDKVLASSTKWIAAAWLLLTLALSFF